MAVGYIWPPSLPQTPQYDGYGENNGVLIAKTKMDKGPAKLRRLGRRPDTLNVNYRMTTAQVATFNSFIDVSLRGVRRFGWPHPRTLQQVEARLIPSEDGQLYSLSTLGPDLWQVSFQLEILP